MFSPLLSNIHVALGMIDTYTQRVDDFLETGDIAKFEAFNEFSLDLRPFGLAVEIEVSRAARNPDIYLSQDEIVCLEAFHAGMHDLAHSLANANTVYQIEKGKQS